MDKLLNHSIQFLRPDLDAGITSDAINKLNSKEASLLMLGMSATGGALFDYLTSCHFQGDD
ncbi:MAG: hypothetical protein AAGD25_06430 [Cyanobacteria bacterium P01_F01_bin.150]